MKNFQGIIVGCDQEQEWMLSWWWTHYIRHNSYPVAFVDFGMSTSAKKWCQRHGIWMPLEAPRNYLFPKTFISTDIVKEWEEFYGEEIWESRQRRFYKPFALYQTPFEETIWVDLDCEIAGTLASLFSKIHSHSKMALAGETTRVVAYHKNSPLLLRWIDLCLQHNDRFLCDQDVLNFLIQSEEIEIAELPSKYHWNIQEGVHLDAMIFHWAGSWGKEVIRRASLV